MRSQHVGRNLVPIALIALSASSMAVFPNRGADTTYTSVGEFGGASAVAIDTRWVLTAQHVNGSVFSLNGTNYNVVQNIEPTIVNGIRPDLRLLQVDADIPTFSRIDFRAPIGTEVTLVGFGQSGNELASGYDFPGIQNGTRRSATNTIEGFETIAFDQNGPEWTTMYYRLSAPTDSSRTAREGGIAAGDSGGGWFANYGQGNVLIATSSAVDSPNHDSGTPYQYGGFGYGTYLGSAESQAFLRTYVPQAIVPEPATLTILGLSSLVMLRRRRR